MLAENISFRKMPKGDRLHTTQNLDVVFLGIYLISYSDFDACGGRPLLCLAGETVVVPEVHHTVRG